jgi:hypothetical protein
VSVRSRYDEQRSGRRYHNHEVGIFFGEKNPSATLDMVMRSTDAQRCVVTGGMRRTKRRSFITISGTVRRGWLDVQQKRWKKSVGDVKFLITIIGPDGSGVRRRQWEKDAHD